MSIKITQIDIEDDLFNHYFCRVTFQSKEEKEKFLFNVSNQPKEWDTKLSNWVGSPKNLTIEAYIKLKKISPDTADNFILELKSFISKDTGTYSWWKKVKNIVTKPIWWWKTRKLV